MSDSLQPHRLYSPCNSPGQNTEVGSLTLLQGIFLTQGSNPGLLHYRQILYQLSHKDFPIFPWPSFSMLDLKPCTYPPEAPVLIPNVYFLPNTYQIPKTYFYFLAEGSIWAILQLALVVNIIDHSRGNDVGLQAFLLGDVIQTEPPASAEKQVNRNESSGLHFLLNETFSFSFKRNFYFSSILCPLR